MEGSAAADRTCCLIRSAERAHASGTENEIPRCQTPAQRETANLKGEPAVYDLAHQQFSDAELTQLTLAIVAINGWNRFNVAFHTPAGSYRAAINRRTA